MKKFVFPLEAALRWRRVRLDQEEAALQALFAKLSQIDSSRQAIEQERSVTEQKFKSNGVSGHDLGALDSFGHYAGQQLVLLEGMKIDLRKQIAAQQEVVIEARRDYELIERLREKQRAAWSADLAREIEAAASESYLAKVVREGSPEAS